jgi:hypothetical protein
MYGKYKQFYISLRETLGSTKTLCIITRLGNDKENLKKVLSVFSEIELPKYCITNLERKEEYLQFTFELGNDKAHLVAEFLDKFIQSYYDCGLEAETICPICKNKIVDGEDVAIIDIGGILTPAHNACYETGKEEAKEKARKKNEEINKDTKGYQSGLLGAIVFGLIYMGILIVVFFLVQFILNNMESGSFARVFQYAPVLVALTACPIIYAGYDAFKGRKGTYKHLIILWTVIISTLLGTFLGFVASLLLLGTGSSFLELMELVGRLISCKDINGFQTFRWGFYVYIVVGLGLSILSMVFKFSGKEEMAEANSATFEKLD